MDGLIIDNFAGGGGASTGIEQALGRDIDVAINHDKEAISMHKANHPNTKHYCEDVWDVDPLEATQGKPVFLAWFSPDCKHFSKAKGARPVSKKIRGLAWLAIKWAKLVKPRMIMLENVEEFQTWGPLGDDSKPCPERKGHTFRSWVKQLKQLGYEVDYRVLRACDYGAPTIRKRLFVVARCDGLPIAWPEATHGEGSFLKPFKTAENIIDWSIPCPSIFTRKKPLAENTLKRIAKGIDRFVINHPDPFIVRLGHTGWNGSKMSYPISKPLTTITSKAEHCLVMPFIAKHYSGVVGQPATSPLGTITSVDHHSLVSSHLIKLRNGQYGQDLRTPCPTLTAEGAHVDEVRAFLLKYYGRSVGQDCREPLQTITSKHRFGLVTIKGENYQIADIGLRMLQPHELYAAQGFPESYSISIGANGERITKTAQVRMCGNSVSPYAARALVEANVKAILKEVAA